MAICTGCNRDSKDIGCYNKENPVEDDGTFLNNKFVCTECYMDLINIGQDVGSPSQIQTAARRLAAVRQRS